MVKVQNRSLVVLLLGVACLIPPALAGAEATQLAQTIENPDTEPVAPTAEPAPPFNVPADGLAAGSTLTIGGSASMATITRSLVQAFEQKYPDVNVTVIEQPSAVALQNLQAGETDLAAIGRTLTDGQKTEGFMPVSISREKIAVIIGADNPFTGQLEATEFVNIFWGTLTNWNQLGGPDLPIRFIDRPESSDTRASLGEYEIFGGDLSSGEGATLVASDSTAEVVAALGDNGISYAIASQVLGQANVRVLSMYGTTPDSPDYPYSQPRNYVYFSGTPLSPVAEAFLALATDSEGQAVVEAAKAAEAADVAVANLPDQVSAVRPDGQGFVTGDRQGNLNFWNADGTPAGEAVPAHTGPVTALALSADGQRLISGGADNTVRLWDAAGTAVGDPINSGSGPVTSLVAQSDGSFLSATNSGLWQRWDPAGQPVGEPIAGHEGAIRDMTLSPDGQTLVTSGEDGTMRLWNVADGAPQGGPITGHQGPVQTLSMQPDGSFFSGGADNTVRQWSPDGAPIGEPLTMAGPVNAIATNPAGNSIAAGDETGALQYLSGDGVPVSEPLTDVGAPVADLAFTPDGQQLLVSAGDAPQLRDSAGQIIPIPEAGADNAPDGAMTSNLPPQLQDFWTQLQGLPPQVLWILPLAALALLLIGLLRSFQQDEADLVDDDDAIALPPTAPDPEPVTDTDIDSFSADDFSADDFQVTDNRPPTTESPTPESPATNVAGFAADITAEPLDPSLAQAKQTLQAGVSLGNAGNYQAALDSFNKAIELADMERLKAAAVGTTLAGASGVIARGLARRGSALANLERPDEALKSLNRALEMDPNDVAAWISKGNVFIPMGQLDEALFCFDKAIELNPNLAAAWQGKAQALQKMGRTAEARNCFQQAEALGGVSTDLPLDLGTPATPPAANRDPATPPSPESALMKPAIEPGPLPDNEPLSELELSVPPPAPRPTPTADDPNLDLDDPIGPIGLTAEPVSSPVSDEALSPDLLSAISDLPPAAPGPTDAGSEATVDSSTVPATITPTVPLPDTPETALPAEILQSIETLPSEPEDADPNSPLTNPVSVPPEVEAILNGSSEIPTAEDTATNLAAIADADVTSSDDDVTVAMQLPSASTNPSARRGIVPGQPEPDDEAAALAGLPPEVLEALQGIPADSPDSFGLSTSATSQPPPL
ncbi:MAG: substrate-binding domain-containing protein, partial [Cyanobacteria bacterium P01_C01_bin.147]